MILALTIIDLLQLKQFTPCLAPRSDLTIHFAIVIRLKSLNRTLESTSSDTVCIADLDIAQRIQALLNGYNDGMGAVGRDFAQCFRTGHAVHRCADSSLDSQNKLLERVTLQPYRRRFDRLRGDIPIETCRLDFAQIGFCIGFHTKGPRLNAVQCVILIRRCDIRIIARRFYFC